MVVHTLRPVTSLCCSIDRPSASYFTRAASPARTNWRSGSYIPIADQAIHTAGDSGTGLHAPDEGSPSLEGLTFASIEPAVKGNAARRTRLGESGGVPLIQHRISGRSVPLDLIVFYQAPAAVPWLALL